MSESAFEKHVRLWLHDDYHPYGAFWNNKTGWVKRDGEGEVVLDFHHAPFCGEGAGDLIGSVFGLWIEVENKARKGIHRKMQKVRQSLVTMCGGLYVKCRESKVTMPDGIDAGYHALRRAIDFHIMAKLGNEPLHRLKESRAFKEHSK